VIFEQPYCRISNLVDAGIAKRQTASEYLKKLVEIRVLQEQQAGREKIFVNPKLMQLLDQPENSFLPYMSVETEGVQTFASSVICSFLPINLILQGWLTF
jgi:hypothetical protein